VVDITQFDQQGFAITESFLAPSDTEALIKLIEQHTVRDDKRGGMRDIVDRVPALQSIASHSAVQSIVSDVLGPGAFVVRTTLFDKTDQANWKVPWHQDLTIAVESRCEIQGYGPWSTKAGVVHVQPPAEVLERMVSVRIHLDHCPAANGALRVMPGTHKLGKLNQNHVDEFLDESLAKTCEASAGQALVMRPLLLHASSASQSPRHRRVLHFDYAAGGLANGLTWHMKSAAVTPSPHAPCRTPDIPARPLPSTAGCARTPRAFIAPM
jgi:ectoine hydroxylase-related dioxygenase (phytanoyl-CoA dioxygenase family)